MLFTWKKQITLNSLYTVQPFWNHEGRKMLSELNTTDDTKKIWINFNEYTEYVWILTNVKEKGYLLARSIFDCHISHMSHDLSLKQIIFYSLTNFEKSYLRDKTTNLKQICKTVVEVQFDSTIIP